MASTAWASTRCMAARKASVAVNAPPEKAGVRLLGTGLSVSSGATDETSSSSTPRINEVILRMVCSGSIAHNRTTRHDSAGQSASRGGPAYRSALPIPWLKVHRAPPTEPCKHCPSRLQNRSKRCVDALHPWIGRVRMDWFVAIMRPTIKAACNLQAV